MRERDAELGLCLERAQRINERRVKGKEDMGIQHAMEKDVSISIETRVSNRNGRRGGNIFFQGVRDWRSRFTMAD